MVVESQQKEETVGVKPTTARTSPDNVVPLMGAITSVRLRAGVTLIMEDGFVTETHSSPSEFELGWGLPKLMRMDMF